MSYQCSVCGRNLQNPGALSTHVRLKHGESLAQSQEKARLLQRELEELKAKLPESQKPQVEEKTLYIEIETPPKHEFKWKCEKCLHEFDDFEENWWGRKICPNCRTILITPD